MDLREAAVLMPEVTSLTVEAELFTIERSAILALVFVILILLTLALVHDLLAIRINGKLLNTVSVLALDTVAAEAGLSPVLAHLTLVHGPLHERLAGEGWRGGRADAACTG